MSKCFAVGCPIQVGAEMFGCRGHWFMVPKGTRNTIWAEYRGGRVLGVKYCDAALDAIRAVAAREGKALTGEERELKLYEQLKERAGR